MSSKRVNQKQNKEVEQVDPTTNKKPAVTKGKVVEQATVQPVVQPVPQKVKPVRQAARAVSAPRSRGNSVKESRVKPQPEEEEEKEENKKKRYFKCMYVNEQGEVVKMGRYAGRKPKQAASKALTAISNVTGQTGKIDYSLVECTRGSKHKLYLYSGEKVLLEHPVEVPITKNGEPSSITYRYSSNVKKLPHEDCPEELQSLFGDLSVKQSRSGRSKRSESAPKKRAQSASVSKKVKSTPKTETKPVKEVKKAKRPVSAKPPTAVKPKQQPKKVGKTPAVKPVSASGKKK